MLRPERMSRISVTGSKRVMDDAIEAIHDQNLLHVTEYDGTWEGFNPGDPVEGAEEAAEKLVTVRALQSTLGVTEDDARARIIGDDELESELEETRQRVNELDDRRTGLEDELREIEDSIETARPFAELELDLDLFAGYDSLTAAVGEGNADEIRAALDDADAVEEYELFVEDPYLALFVYPRIDIQDALVGVSFTEYEVPEVGAEDEATSPEDYIEDLQHRQQQIRSELETVESEVEDVRHEVSSFLLAAEEKLAIEVQKREAPLTFATTESAFIAEGWVPTERRWDIEDALEDAVGDHVEVEELERASYNEDGHAHDRQSVDESGRGEAVATDGGAEMSGGKPPVIQSNPDPVKPFETLVGVINRPSYDEVDPTLILFLTFPAFFGFMIGDLGYGILYVVLGYLLMSRFESDAIRSLGGVGVAAGIFTGVFGVLYGEFFGLHQLGEIVWGGSPPIHKGLTPTHANYAIGWLVVSLLIGMVHLAVGWMIDFYQNLSHGVGDAVLESGSWLLMMFGLWAWVFADAPPTGAAPDLLTTAESGVFAGHPFALGFTGFDPIIGFAGLALFVLGFALLVAGEPIEGVEFLNVLVNVLSYTRIAAVLLAKAGMAFVVNLLVFGVYVTEETHGGETVDAWHFGLGGMPEGAGTMFHGHEVVEIMSPGLVHGGIAAVLVGALVLVIGHLLVLALGVTSAGLQGVRLEYVEFFGKFYEGGGKEYRPFGHDRTYTTED
ncbi:MAG: V/A-type H+-transporting ATPase subunit I [Natronomonas sp.]|jgi:V/A-type H+-transporting ATPase subunit I|uniref:V-type ATP synthase subunit I n=1 Tax=Natronomonas sp. TaxID=2184060 RepID=UPI003989275B